jgi:hypothetical protein
MVRRMVASEPIAATELGTAERILARLVALAYAGDHPDLFTAGPEEPSGVPISPRLCGNIGDATESQ